MGDEQKMDEVAGKVDEAKAAAEEERRSRIGHGADEELTPVEPPQRSTDEDFSPS